MRFILESQLLELVCVRERRKAEGTPAKNKINATSSITVPANTPIPRACRMLETYPNSNEQIPAILASGMQIAAMNIAM